MKIVCVDATNIKAGGGVTHLIEFFKSINAINNKDFNFIIWSNKKVLDKIENSDLLIKKHSYLFEKNFIFQIVWRKFFLPRELKLNKCNILFVPGGSYIGSFKPVVSMCRNMLPFEKKERNYYFFSMQYIKLLILRYIQINTFKKSNGVIFLSNYAKDVILRYSKNTLKNYKIIPHGISNDYKFLKKNNNKVEKFTNKNPIKLIYVSTIDYYKHQDHVVLAVKKLKDNGYPVILDLIGSSYTPALKKLNKVLNKIDKNRSFIKYHNHLNRVELIKFYKNADIGIFASSCENLPNILLEYLAAKIPTVCSRKSPMKDILGDNGLYFDPTDSDSIFYACKKLIDNVEQRNLFSEKSHNLVEKYSWKNNAMQTLGYFKDILER